ncbi:MAG: YlbF family regulator [Eubacteriales bacterium]
MEEILTPEMKEIIANLGALIKADSRCRAIEETIADYERSEELNGLIAEYNAQQNALADAYSKEGEEDEALRTAVQARIDTLYDQITEHPVYVAYVDAKQAFDELTNEVYGELQFVITGRRPCSHDCSSCHSDCGHEHH